MNQCPQCHRYSFDPAINRCSFCQFTTRPKTVTPYTDIGKEIVHENWGKVTNYTMSETIANGSMELQTVSLLAAILQELQETRKANQAAAERIVKAIKDAPAKAEIALEKERQKTADKLKKANEAAPTLETVIQCPNEIIDRIPVRKIRGKW